MMLQPKHTIFYLSLLMASCSYMKKRENIQELSENPSSQDSTNAYIEVSHPVVPAVTNSSDADVIPQKVDDSLKPIVTVVLEEEDSIAEGQQTLEQKALLILEGSCASCHTAQSDGGFASVLDVQKMLEQGYVVAGSPETSSVYIRTNPEAAGTMPIGSGLLPEQRELLHQWILELKVAEKVVENISWSSVHALAQDDLENNVSPAQRDQTRYVSFHHLNEVGSSDIKKQRSFDALVRTLNSVSKSSQVIKPIVVDATHGLYRFFLSDIGLSQELYRATYENYNPFQFFDSQDDAGIFLRNEIGPDAVVRGDWLISTALLPPIYKLWLDLPDSLQELKANLGIGSESFLEKPTLVRAGFVDSRVSTQNRVIQREQTSDGRFFWESFDFLENTGLQNVLLKPLGPITENPEGSAFEQDGGEMIFELPNGFMGFYLSDGVGNYLEKGPKPVVLNEEGPEGFDQNILNGFSCMDCHRAGLIPHTDQVRNYAGDGGFSAEEVAQILAYYPENSVVESYIKGDSDRYQKAIEDSGNQTPLVEDVIREVYKEYRAEVSLSQAALELDVSEEMLKLLLINSETFRDEWSGFLIGETIVRSQFNKLFGSAKRIYDSQVFIPFEGDLSIDTECMQGAGSILDLCVNETVNVDLE
ncbi:MAG: hypothetical protein AB8C84_08775 [Oligoflexales bacterium]